MTKPVGGLLHSNFDEASKPGGGVCRTMHCYSYRTGGGHLCAMHEMLFIAEFNMRSVECWYFATPCWHWRP